MGDYPSGSTHHDSLEEDDDDDYEEADGGNRLLGFMFGNVDGSGDLDVDYLDEDAKEHLSALADKLGPSLSEINLSIKLPQAPADASEEDYDEKADDAVDYEDIEEQYDGPEIQAISEEDHLLPRKEYFSAEVSLDSLHHTNSVFGEDNYDEDEAVDEQHDVVDNSSEGQANPSQGLAGSLSLEHSLEGACNGETEMDLLSHLEQGEDCVLTEKKYPEETIQDLEFSEEENPAVDLDEFQEDELDGLQESGTDEVTTSLPTLCIENGKKVLRFSEIFGVHEPLKKREKSNRSYSFPKERNKSMDASDIVEEDDVAFLRCPILFTPKQLCRDDAMMKNGDKESVTFDSRQGFSMKQAEIYEQNKVTSLSALAMKDSGSANLAAGWESPYTPEFYPLDQQDWENEIIWDNSPLVSRDISKSNVVTGFESDDLTNIETELEAVPSKLTSEFHVDLGEKDHTLFLQSYPVLIEPFGSRNSSDTSSRVFWGNHPQLLRLESRFKLDDSIYVEVQKDNNTGNLRKDDAIRHFSKLSLRNMEMLNGSWLDKVIWDTNVPITKPKLILDLQDEQMAFEILEKKDGGHLCLHAGAMIITRSMKVNGGDLFETTGQGGMPAGRFNISNDKYYLNRKISQQLKSHSKKRAAHGVKILHSQPALKLQTMKPKLSNKDISNFHRPKALWYPHDNEVVAKEQGKLSTQGPMKVILKSMGGKGTKLHVDAEEIVSSVKAKASKKLDFKPTEMVKIVYSGKELEDEKSLSIQNVRPNSILHLVRTKIHLWPRAQKLPGENKSLRPPGAFKKKSDLSVKDGHVFLMEYCEERPLLLGNVGMGARLCTYYQKSAPADQNVSLLRNGSESLGTLLALDPADKSPFLGDIRPSCSQSCLETNMYRAPIFPHKLPTTDYLLVRSAKGKLSLRRIDRINVVGQQEPHMEVISPGSKNCQTYLGNRLLVYMYRESRANEKRGLPPSVRADELLAQFPNLSEPFLRKRLKHCADLQKGSNGQLYWVIRRNFRIPLEEELRRMVTPENVCSYESMLAGLYRLKRLGISKLTHTVGLSSAMNQLPDEAIALAAASHIERELQITPWNLSTNFVACTNQDRENIERLEITGVGDPSGRGLGFSFVRVAPKAPIPSAVVKKKAAIARGSSTVTGTDADLRRLSMEAAREVLLKFNVPEEQIGKQTRWHRIAMIRKLSSEQAASGVKVDPTTISKYARGQRMSFLQLQQQTREKCQEIWDRQLQSLSAAEGDENESDSEANSDLDSFAGDLENLLDAEEFGEVEVGNYEAKHDKADSVRLKMRRYPSQALAQEEIEDEAAEAAELCRMLMDDDEAERRKKNKIGPGGREANTTIKQIIRTTRPDGSFTSNDNIYSDSKELGNSLTKKTFSAKLSAKKGSMKNDIMLKKKNKAILDGFKVFKEKKHTDKPVREGFVCGACGQPGHMRTNKNCPRYGEDLDMQIEGSGLERKTNILDSSLQPQPKPSIKKLIPKVATKMALVEIPESSEKGGSKTKLKLKCGPTDKLPEHITTVGTHNFDQQVTADYDTGYKSVTKISKLKISNKIKPEDTQVEPPKPSIVFRPPAETELRQQPPKKITFKQPKGNTNVEQVKSEGNSTQEEYRKTKKIIDISISEMQKKQENKRLADEAAIRRAKEDKIFWDNEKKRRIIEEERRQNEERRQYEERRQNEERIQAEQQRRAEQARRYNERELESRERLKAKKKKKMRELSDDYYEEQMPPRHSQRIPERNQATKKRPGTELGRFGLDYGPQTKRRRGNNGQVGLSNIIQGIVDSLKDAIEVSHLFLKPVSKRVAPDYFDIIKEPMDLSTIKQKAKNMEYKNRDEFRHDVWQITYNAHQYNDGRHPTIPPLADQLLELCDYLLQINATRLSEAEAGL